jgi:hypothetical protein
MALPDWLLKRARDGGYTRAFTMLDPQSEHGAAIYLLQGPHHYELHAVEDAASGVDGFTGLLTYREAQVMARLYVGALSGRLEGAEIIPPRPARPPLETP